VLASGPIDRCGDELEVDCVVGVGRDEEPVSVDW
jgi:hypothetical protein